MIPAPKIPNGPPVPVEARCVRLPAKAENTAALTPEIERRILSRAPNELLIGPNASRTLRARLDGSDPMDRRMVELKGKAEPVEVVSLRIAPA